jgi:hypothetical protein
LTTSEEEEQDDTGFNYLDDLSDEQLADYLQRFEQHWNSLSPARRKEHFEAYYEAIKGKRKSDPKFMNMSQEDIMREILNVDMPRQHQLAIEEAEREGRHRDAELLRSKRPGIDYFTLEIHGREGIVLE